MLDVRQEYVPVKGHHVHAQIYGWKTTNILAITLVMEI